MVVFNTTSIFLFGNQRCPTKAINTKFRFPERIMKYIPFFPFIRWRWLALGVALSLNLAAQPETQAQDMDPFANEVLREMATYLAETEAFSVNADIDFEVMARTGQKLQFSSYATLLLARPDGLHIERQGPIADTELYFNGEALTVFGRRLNVYAQQPVTGTIDDAILALEQETGIPLPGADLLFADPYAILSEGVESSTYLGIAYIDGVEVHHLAFREADMDWQLWVQTGDVPLPMKYVITSKWLAGAPQYQVRLRDWNTAPAIANDVFTFVVPMDATELEALPPSQFEDVPSTEENQS